MKDVMDLSSIERHVFGNLDPQSHFVAANFDDRHDNVVADDELLVLLARKDPHGNPPCAGKMESLSAYRMETPTTKDESLAEPIHVFCWLSRSFVPHGSRNLRNRYGVELAGIRVS